MGAIDGRSVPDQVEAIYIGYFGRASEIAGQDYWVTTMENNPATWTLSHTAASFFQQAETQAKYQFAALYAQGQRSFTSQQLADFINGIYSDAFSRQADSAGLSYWEAYLIQNINSVDAIGAFVIAVLNGAQDVSPNGPFDLTTIGNKITVANDFTGRTALAGRGLTEPISANFKTAAVGCIAPVTNVSTTIATGEAVTTNYLAGPA